VTPEQLQVEVTKFLSSARAKAADGKITVAEFGGLVVELLELVVSGLESVSGLDGAAKKAWAIQVVGLLFDAVATAAVPIYLQPFWLIVRPAVRSLVLAAAGGALEHILTMVRTPAAPAAPAIPEVKA
jgi:hypothetical protein